MRAQGDICSPHASRVRCLRPVGEGLGSGPESFPFRKRPARAVGSRPGRPLVPSSRSCSSTRDRGANEAPQRGEERAPRHHTLFTETPHDMTAHAGEDVEMACSFRGSGSPSYSLEIQWWYVRNHKDWTDKQTWASSQLKASQQEEAGKDATKISVVKVVGSNISHKLRLSRVKPTDEGTYECRVIDFSDGKARHHKVKAFLRVSPEESAAPRRHGSSSAHLQDTQLLGAPPAEPAAHLHHQHKAGKELKKRSADASCLL
ncbi:PREDICTED: V-set and transmembrane domain-containing protein 2-like protein [Gavialis gangeticus]|uniref:V-set and transmembrane domain-containing protein 2-like protein n=1 Tax=Gavialis gangeticus TaxID=94835 RepID=UPI00092E77D4|nr:PREDICTED: V-set and transmembrane domain-containing protein 2-like protein [Gavialis gangeticus]